MTHESYGLSVKPAYIMLASACRLDDVIVKTAIKGFPFMADL